MKKNARKKRVRQSEPERIEENNPQFATINPKTTDRKKKRKIQHITDRRNNDPDGSPTTMTTNWSSDSPQETP
jgi:hypothetical protein